MVKISKLVDGTKSESKLYVYASDDFCLLSS